MTVFSTLNTLDNIHSRDSGTRATGAGVKRSIRRNGHRSSVSLEDPFWHALREIAVLENVALPKLIERIDRGPNKRNLSSAIRVFVLDYFRRRVERRDAADQHSPEFASPGYDRVLSPSDEPGQAEPSIVGPARKPD